MDTAFVPIYARKKRHERPERTAEFVNHIFTILVLILLPLSVVAIACMPSVIAVIAPGFSGDAARFELAVSYSRIVFGFLFLISLSTLQGSLLNAHSRFMPLAAAPAVLNTVMIAGFVVAVVFHWDVGLCGSWSMIGGGIVQLIMLQICCWKMNLHMQFARPRWTKDVKQFFKLVGPGVIGVSATQVNVLISTMLASTLPSGAIAALYYADRLNQLPLGVIGGALSTTLLPVLTHHIAAKEGAKVISHFTRAIEIGLLLCLPACLILVLAPIPIVRILFEHGVFNTENTRITAETIAAYSLVIPGSILIRVFTTRFYAHEDTKTPVIVGLVSIIMNTVLSLVFKEYWQHVGLALSISVNAGLNAFLLWFLLERRGNAKIDATGKKRIPKLLLAAAVMGIALWLSAPMAKSISVFLFHTQFLIDVTGLSIRILISACAYAATLKLTRAMPISDLRSFRRKA
jgi:putative peptidoglycan lipid II flippase